MSNSIHQRLIDLDIEIPQAAIPVANYVTFAQSGHQIFISGQLPLKDGKLLSQGKVGHDVSIDDAKKAAESCAINVLAQAQAALGDLTKIKRVVKIVVFVASAADFYDIPQVANGASDLFVNVLGEAGKHTRSSVGVASLPLNATVEVEAILEI